MVPMVNRLAVKCTCACLWCLVSYGLIWVRRTCAENGDWLVLVHSFAWAFTLVHWDNAFFPCDWHSSHFVRDDSLGSIGNFSISMTMWHPISARLLNEKLRTSNKGKIIEMLCSICVYVPLRMLDNNKKICERKLKHLKCGALEEC